MIWISELYIKFLYQPSILTLQCYSITAIPSNMGILGSSHQNLPWSPQILPEYSPVEEYVRWTLHSHIASTDFASSKFFALKPPSETIIPSSRTGTMNPNIWNTDTSANPHSLDMVWAEQFLIYPNSWLHERTITKRRRPGWSTSWWVHDGWEIFLN